MSKIIITGTLDRETKGTVRYAENTTDGARPTIGTIYILKDKIEKVSGAWPASITVTVEATPPTTAG